MNGDHASIFEGCGGGLTRGNPACTTTHATFVSTNPPGAGASLALAGKPGTSRSSVGGLTVRVMSMGARPAAYSAAIFSRSAAAFNSAAFASTNSTMWSTITAPSMV